MTDPVGFFLLLTVGIFAFAVGVVGLRRGRAVALVEQLRFTRAGQPIRFWYAVSFQLLVGAACLVSAAIKAVT
jgi:hypothetical protein